MSDNIKVVVKIRPLISREIEEKLSYQWRVNNNTLYQLDQNGKDLGQVFTFDKVYDKNTKTKDVYDDIAKPIVKSAIAGFNGTIFAYGQTSSGKTYTMTGTKDSPGIIQMAIMDLFEIIQNIPGRDFLVRVSYLEIYNEMLKDLLNGGKEIIKIHESLKGIKVDANEKVVSSPEEVFDVMSEGETNRQTGATNMNEKSSRSHSIFQIIIESREHVEGESESGSVKVSQLNLVDLAGSERAGQTGATGIRFKEGTLINKSLSALGLVIKQLSEDPKKFTNYRDSKLTRILQNSLGGNAKTSIICAITPAAIEETISTLQFANRAKAIKNKPEVNVLATEASMIQELTKKLSKLQAQLKDTNLKSLLEQKKHVEKDNIMLQNKIASMKKMILNGFAQRSTADIITGRRKQPLRRVTISTLHSIEEHDTVPEVPKFCTPALKYNPLIIPGVSEFAPIPSFLGLESLPEEPSRSVTPPARHRKVGSDDDVIVLDSDDDDDAESSQQCSPYHKCYEKKATPPCVLRKNAKVAERNYQDIMKLTEREKIYAPSVIELMEKLENNNSVINKLKDRIEELNEESKQRDLEVGQLKAKIESAEDQARNMAADKINLEAECKGYKMKLTDVEVSYETLKKKAKLREEELLSLLDEQMVKKTQEIGKLSGVLDKEIDNFMNLSKEVSLVNSDNESNSSHQTEDESSANLRSLVSDLESQIIIKSQRILELEENFCTQRERIEFLENSSQEIQKMNDDDTCRNKLANIEDENSLLKNTIETLNDTIESQRKNLEIAHKNLEECNSVIQQLQTTLNNKDDVCSIKLNDTLLNSMIENEKTLLVNNDNFRNIVYSFKKIIENRDKEINDLKNNANVFSNDNHDNRVESLNSEIDKLQEQIRENVATVNKLVREKNVFKTIEKDLTDKLAATQEMLNNYKALNEKNLDEIAVLKKSNDQLLEKIESFDNSNTLESKDNLLQKVDEMSKQIINLENEIQQRDHFICKLQKEDISTQEHLDKAKVALNKLQNVTAILTGHVKDFPDVIDNFLNVFNTLCQSLNVLENTANDVMLQKERTIKISLELQEKYEKLLHEHKNEKESLLEQINKIQDSEKLLIANNQDLSQQNLCKIKALELKVDSLIIENRKLQESLNSQEHIIINLKETDNISCIKIQSLQKEKMDIEQNLLNDIQNLKTTLESKRNIFEEMLQSKEKNILDLSSNMKEKENELNEKCIEICYLHEQFNQEVTNTNRKFNTILEKVTELLEKLDLGNTDELGTPESINTNDGYKNIMFILNNVQNLLTKYEQNYTELLSKAQEQIGNLNAYINKQNKSNNLILIKEIQKENQNLSSELITSDEIYKNLQGELKSKHDELDHMVDTVRDWKDKFLELDNITKKQIEELKFENENLKLQHIKLQKYTEDKIHDITEETFYEYFQNKQVDTPNDTIPKKYSPERLVKICCKKVFDCIQPKSNDNDTIISSTNSSTSTEIETKKKYSKKCMCSQLSLELDMIQSENLELTCTVENLKVVNDKLMNELDEVRTEVDLLLDPAYELHKKITGHKTNLSILTATTYAENKSLISQVKGLRHHHNRFHNVCDRDLPALKNQLYGLLSILRDSASTSDTLSTDTNRYSLADVFDNEMTVTNLRNESTLDGDLLMLDTNVTLNTADNTLIGCDPMCSDVNQTMFNEVSCQTDETNAHCELQIAKSQVLFPNKNNENMICLLEKLKDESDKLHKQNDILSKSNSFEEKTSVIQIESNRLTDICNKCKDIEELKLSLENLESNYKNVLVELSVVQNQKANIKTMYDSLKLEIPNTDALVKKFNELEKDHSNKTNEIVKLTSKLNSAMTELKHLQEENNTLSTQIFDHVSETDDLYKELEKLKQQNKELVENYSYLQKQQNEPSNIKCSQCEIRNNTITSLQTKCISESLIKKKLNRSYSDSDTSSRYNTICTLQSELNAGQEDCKELTEDFSSIKHHLERSNISMDLDTSMGDTSLYVQPMECLTRSPQMKTCIMPDIQEEHLLDEDVFEKFECLKYYTEKTGIKTDMSSTTKTIDIMKMFYDNLVVKHGNEVENLSNKLKDYDKSCNELQVKVFEITQENENISKKLQEKEIFNERFTHIISLLKNNISFINKESEKLLNSNKNDEVIDIFKEYLLKVLDAEFGLESVDIFSISISNIIKKYECDLSKLQENLNKVANDLDAAKHDLTSLKCQLNDKDKDLELVRAQKERIHEISNAVTLDIVNRQKILEEIVLKQYKKLVDLNPPNYNIIDMQEPISKNVDSMFEHLWMLLDEKSASLEKKNKLNQEIEILKCLVLCREREIDVLTASNTELDDTINKISVDLKEEKNKFENLSTLYEDLKNVYLSKIDENQTNLNLISKLTEEVAILKKKITHLEATINSLNENKDNAKDLAHKIKELQDENSTLQKMNEFINKEKEEYAKELEAAAETIKRNNVEIDKMTSDMLTLRESVKHKTSIIEDMKDETKLLLKQNQELKEQVEVKCQECKRLEMNMKTHEKAAVVQSRIITRLQKQKNEDDILLSDKDKQLIEINTKYVSLQQDYDELQKVKESLQVRISELEFEMENKSKGRPSIGSIAESARKRRQSLHDSKRLFAEDKLQFEEDNNFDLTFDNRHKPDEQFMDVDMDSDRSTPIRLSKGRDSLQSRTDQSERDEDHSSRPSSVQAIRKRRQSSHDLHRSVARTPSSLGDNTLNKQTDTSNRDGEVTQLKEKLASVLEELEDLKEKYKELDDECETCAEYLHERNDQCARLMRDKDALKLQLNELQEKMQSISPSNEPTSKPTVTHVAVNTEKDWTNLHSVVVDRMSYDAEVEKNRRLVKIVEELRYSKHELKNAIAQMKKNIEKQSSGKDDRELQATRNELAQCKKELEELRQSYKELDDECETCAEYLKERDEQILKLKETKNALEAKLRDLQDEDASAMRAQSARKRRQTMHDSNRDSAVEVNDASTETAEALMSSQMERNGSSSSTATVNENSSCELKRLKMMVDKLTHQKAVLEKQLSSLSNGPLACPTMYVATGSAIVQNQQISDVLKENQKLKKINAKLVHICKKRGAKFDANRENEDPTQIV